MDYASVKLDGGRYVWTTPLVNKYDNTISVIRERRLAIPRYQCSIHARIAVSNHETNCKVHDVSIGGLGISVDSVVRLSSGQNVIITAPELGSLRATVKWVTPLRAGVAFIPNSNDLSHVKALVAAFEAQRINQTE